MRLLIDLQAAQGVSALRGIGRYSLELAQAMIRQPRGHNVEVALNAALPDHSWPLLRRLRGLLPRDAVTCWHALPGSRRIGGDPRHHAASTVIRAHALLARAPDVIHVASMFEGSGDDCISHWPRALPAPPTAVTFYDAIPLIRRETYLDGAWAASGLKEWYLGCLDDVRRCEQLLAISASSATEAVEHLGIATGRVANLRAGVSPRFALRAAAPFDEAAFRARLGLPADYVLFLGAGEPRKNEQGLVRAMALLPPALRRAHPLVIVGRMDAAGFQGMIAEAGLSPAEAVQLPWVEEADLPALYAAARLFVFPSLHEGFGLPALEAMACGTVTLASNTTSLPEVVGHPDALFDPHDPAAMAARIEAALTDAALAGRLRAHGLARAAEFTWEASADRAWDALEAMPPRAPPATPARPRLAHVSPLPGAASGIADYSAELLPGLATHYDITLFTENPTAVAPALAQAFPVADEATLPARQTEFDRVVYQIGNSPFHTQAIFDLLPQVPGVVVQHDAFLSGALFHRGADEPGGVPRLVFEAEGWRGLLTLNEGDLMRVLVDLPCSMPLLSQALGTVVHSTHAAALQRRAGGPDAARPALVPLLRAIPALPERAAARVALGLAPDALVVTSFGMMAATKCPDVLVRAFGRAFGGNPSAQLVFAGAAEPDPALAMRPAGAAGVADRVRVTGRLATSDYRDWLAASDIAVQLRTMSRGESSGAITDAMAAGLPVVVNAHGAAAELPADAVMLLMDAPDEAALADALSRLAGDAAARRKLGAAARAHVARDLNPASVAARYRDAVEAIYRPSDALMQTHALHDLALLESPAGATARALARSFPPRLPRRLLLASALPETTALRALIMALPPHWRVEWLRLDGGVAVLDRQLVAATLRLTAVASDAVLELGPGDRIVVPLAAHSQWRRQLEAAQLAGAEVLALGTDEVPDWADGALPDGAGMLATAVSDHP